MKSTIVYKGFLILGLSFQVLLLASCDNTNREELKAKELELKKRELKIREQELNAPPPAAAPEPTTPSPEPTVPSPPSEATFVANAFVNGNFVILRADHSTTSAKLKSMKKNEGLIILDEFIPDGNFGEAILTEKTNFYSEYNGVFIFSLPRGKAVMVEGRSDENRYDISYQDVNSRSKGFAKIDSNSLEFISGKTWYHVRLVDGTSGWVFSEFVQKM